MNCISIHLLPYYGRRITKFEAQYKKRLGIDIQKTYLNIYLWNLKISFTWYPAPH